LWVSKNNTTSINISKSFLTQQDHRRTSSKAKEKMSFLNKSVTGLTTPLTVDFKFIPNRFLGKNSRTMKKTRNPSINLLFDVTILVTKSIPCFPTLPTLLTIFYTFSNIFFLEKSYKYKIK